VGGPIGEHVHVDAHAGDCRWDGGTVIQLGVPRPRRGQGLEVLIKVGRVRDLGQLRIGSAAIGIAVVVDDLVSEDHGAARERDPVAPATDGIRHVRRGQPRVQQQALVSQKEVSVGGGFAKTSRTGEGSLAPRPKPKGGEGSFVLKVRQVRSQGCVQTAGLDEAEGDSQVHQRPSAHDAGAQVPPEGRRPVLVGQWDAATVESFELHKVHPCAKAANQ